jgi:non-specific serine/threonine protein kinase
VRFVAPTGGTEVASRSARGTGNLPAEITTFVGRQVDANALAQALRDARLVTLTGIGGIGKTELALHVARKRRRAFPDGVWLIELAEIEKPDGVFQAVAEALRAEDQVGRTDTLDALADYLSDKQLLLVLDNCEQVISKVTVLTSRLLGACAELQILATSREALRVAGEVEYRVGPLPIPESQDADTPQQLFSDAELLLHHRAALVGYDLTRARRQSVVRLLRQLQGHPLAIVLAAGWLTVLSLDQLVDRLGQHGMFQLLHARTMPDRHQTLKAALTWSWELCSAAEQRLWALLSVFASRFDLAAAEAVCADHTVDEHTPIGADEVLDLLRRLCDKSVLEADTTVTPARYRMLCITRQYGAEQLQNVGEAAHVRLRHARYYRNLAEAVAAGDDEVDAALRLHQELPNIRVALEFCCGDALHAEMGLNMVASLARTKTWFVARLGEAREWIRRLLAVGSQQPSELRATAMAIDSWITSCLGEPPEAAERLEQARHEALACGRSPDELPALWFAAGMHLLMGRRELMAASDAFAHAATLSEQLDAPRDALVARLYVAVSAALGDDPAAAHAAGERVLRSIEGQPHRWTRHWMRCWSHGLQDLSFPNGDPQRMLDYLRDALRAIRAGDLPLSAWLRIHDIEGVGWASAALRDDAYAACCLGAGWRARRIAGVDLAGLVPMQQEHDRWVAVLRDRMGPKAFAAAWDKGAKLDPEAAVTYALGPTGRQPDRAKSVDDLWEGLTKREREVVELAAQKFSDKEIARRLGITDRTVASHLEHAYLKLGINSRKQLIEWLTEARVRAVHVHRPRRV